MKLKDFYLEYNRPLNRFFLIHERKLFISFKLDEEGKLFVSAQHEKELAKLYKTPEGCEYFDNMTRKIKDFYTKQAKLAALAKSIEELFYIDKNGALKG